MANPERKPHWKESTGNLGIGLGIIGGILWFLTNRPELLGAAILAGIGGYAIKKTKGKGIKTQF